MPRKIIDQVLRHSRLVNSFKTLSLTHTHIHTKAHVLKAQLCRLIADSMISNDCFTFMISNDCFTIMISNDCFTLIAQAREKWSNHLQIIWKYVTAICLFTTGAVHNHLKIRDCYFTFPVEKIWNSGHVFSNDKWFSSSKEANSGHVFSNGFKWLYHFYRASELSFEYMCQ